MFVYIDGTGVCHATEKRPTGEKKVVESRYACLNGYPYILGQVIVIEDGEAFVGSNSKKGKPLKNCSLEMQKAVKDFMEETGLFEKGE